jgi:two-component system, LytTR family, sensor kinase
MNKKQIILIHIVFWTLDCIAYVTAAYQDNSDFLFLYSFIARRILDASLFYLCYFIVSSKLYSFKNITIYVISFLIFIGLYSILYGYISANISIHFINPKLIFGDIFGIYYRTGIVNLFTMFVFGTFLKITILWYNANLKQKEIEKENIKNELASLRAQINPHFFFNTLNNIKSFASINSDKTLHIIDKLSETMSYILYESAIEKINFEKEIEFIRNYLELQKIRYDNPNYIEFRIRGEYSNLLIPPLLFIPFIENAFKHGDKLAPSPGIKINFNIEKNKIFFQISNYLKNDDGIKRTKGGFGLANIRRRLDLLFVKNYNLEIINHSNQFNVKLLINYYDN